MYAVCTDGYSVEPYQVLYSQADEMWEDVIAECGEESISELGS